MTKYLIFDSGALINITQNGLIDIFRDLEKVFQGDFIITPQIMYETIDHPLQIKRFEWGALRVKSLIDDEMIRRLEDEDLIDQRSLNDMTQKVMDLANNAFTSDGKSIHLIERGESEAMALAILLKEKNIDCGVVIDERTARMICENPENLRLLMESKLHMKIDMKKDGLKMFEKIKVIRSTELIYMAHKKNIFDGDRDKRTLEAMLYALKFGGCSISEKEIEIMKKL